MGTDRINSEGLSAGRWNAAWDYAGNVFKSTAKILTIALPIVIGLGAVYFAAYSAKDPLLDPRFSEEDIENELLNKMMICHSDPQIQEASTLLSNSLECNGKVSEEILENYRNALNIRCNDRDQCREKYSSQEAFQQFLHDQMDDLVTIKQRLPYASGSLTPTVRKLLALKRELSDTHYLFSHGMNRFIARIPKLISKLDQYLWPNRNSDEFIFARVVPPGQSQMPLHEMMVKISAPERIDHDFREELLCADADLLNNEAFESALFFYKTNSNVFDSVYMIACGVFKNFAKQFDIDLNYDRDCRRYFELFPKEEKFESPHGILLIYAVPKDLIQNPDTNFVYTSFPCGKPIDRENALARFEEVVATDKNLGISVRLLTSHLKPENGIKAFWFGEREDRPTDWESIVAGSFLSDVLSDCSRRSFESKINPECERLLQEYLESK